MMYKELINYSGLFDDFGTEDWQFDPAVYIDYKDVTACFSEVDLSLLYEGSAIKIICGVLQCWGQGGYPEKESYYTVMANELLAKNRLDHIPELRESLRVCLESESQFNKFRESIYENYVIGYLKTLCG